MSEQEPVLGPPGVVRRRLERWIDEAVGSEFRDKLATVSESLNEFGVDAFGFDPQYLSWWVPFAHFMYRKYFRTECFGTENVPEGPVLLVANHSGQIPMDGMLLASAMLFDREPPRMLRSMLERWVPSLPFVSTVFARCGQVLGTPENCRRLLDNGEAILVFPEGVRGISKTWDKRYQLQSFGLGFMRLALESGCPIVPVAVIGGEEQAPSFHNARSLARLIGAPAFPITPTFPWLLPVGVLPYPVKYRLWFGEPLSFTGDPDDEDSVIDAKVERVKKALDALISRGLEDREHVFW